MKEHKISFIICWNRKFYLEECRRWLKELTVPKGVEVEIIEIEGAPSMTAGYNEGMRQSDAKYKVYLHQDVFIRNPNFISDVLEIFQKDEKIGMLGMVGTPYMYKTGTMWNGIRFGGFYRLEEYNEKKQIGSFYPVKTGYLEVEAIDGLLMATQYDVPWREDLFTKWDFYDVSQSFEFIKRGYKVVVPGQDTDWYFHDCGDINLYHYDEERKKFLKNYEEYMKKRENQSMEEYRNKVKENIRNGFTGTKEEKEHLLSLTEQLAEKEKVEWK